MVLYKWAHHMIGPACLTWLYLLLLLPLLLMQTCFHVYTRNVHRMWQPLKHMSAALVPLILQLDPRSKSLSHTGKYSKLIIHTFGVGHFQNSKFHSYVKLHQVSSFLEDIFCRASLQRSRLGTLQSNSGEGWPFLSYKPEMEWGHLESDRILNRALASWY